MTNLKKSKYKCKFKTKVSNFATGVITRSSKPQEEEGGDGRGVQVQSQGQIVLLVVQPSKTNQSVQMEQRVAPCLSQISPFGHVDANLDFLTNLIPNAS